MKWFKKSNPDTGTVDVDAALEKASAAKQRLSFTWPTAERRAQFFAERKGQNGFGEDFEFTLNQRPEGTL